jgi:hypothetical protein
MSYRTMLPDEAFHGATAGSRGVINSLVTQAAVQFDTQAVVYYGAPLRIKAPQAMLLLKYTKGAETSINVGMVVYGADAILQESYQVNSTNFPFLSGQAYSVARSSLENTPWSLTGAAIAASITAAYPIHFGSVAPGCASWLPSTFMRVNVLANAVNPNATTLVHIEIAWAENI